MKHTRKTKQAGDAHALVIVGLVLALVTALGWIFWQNFIHKEPIKRDTDLVIMNKKNDSKLVTKPKKLFEDNGLSISYPDKGWQVISNDQNEKSLVSDDYKQATGMGLDSGATITIHAWNVNPPQSLKDPTGSLPGISEVKQLKIAGYDGYTYKLAYEGLRYKATFQVNQTRYQIELFTAEPDRATPSQKIAFDLAVETAKLK